MKDTDYLELDLESSSTQNTPKKTPLNLAIPAGGIDADISDTLSIKSWDSKTGRQSSNPWSSTSSTGSEFGSIMRHVILKARSKIN